MYEFCYDYGKPKYGKKGKLCCIDTGSFILCIKTDVIIIKVLQKMLKRDLILQVFNQIDHC